MKKVFRYLLIVIAVLIILVGGFVAFVAFRGIPKYTAENFTLKVASSPQRLEKGRQLAAMLCAGCHLDPNTHKLTGREMDEVAQFGSVHSRNITNDPEHGIGKLKRKYLAAMMGERYLNEMAAIKRALDPNGILGRGNMFDESYL